MTKPTNFLVSLNRSFIDKLTKKISVYYFDKDNTLEHLIGEGHPSLKIYPYVIHNDTGYQISKLKFKIDEIPYVAEELMPSLEKALIIKYTNYTQVYNKIWLESFVGKCGIDLSEC